jgi:hypothetical protein
LPSDEYVLQAYSLLTHQIASAAIRWGGFSKSSDSLITAPGAGNEIKMDLNQIIWNSTFLFSIAVSFS